MGRESTNATPGGVQVDTTKEMAKLTPTSADGPDDEKPAGTTNDTPDDWVDDYDPARYRPYVLWFDTLPSGDTAQVYICPHGTDAYAVLHWNGQFSNVKTCASIEEAERKGWECLAALLNPKKPPEPPEPPDPDSGLRYLAMDPRYLFWAK